MRKLMAIVAALLSVGACGATFSAVTATTSWADTDVQPVGSVPIPDGPAQTWIVADLDSGQVLAGRDQDVAHPPASTIKVLLALVALDELNLNSTVVADVADTQVECNCVGVKPGRTYTARQLLDGLLLVSGNDAANTLAHMLGGPDVTVDKMNAKAAALGATEHLRGYSVRPRRTRRLRRLDGTRLSRHLPGCDGQSNVRAHHRRAVGNVPR